jgi:hypothetical protein
VRLKAKFLTSAGVILTVSAMGMASVAAAPPPPVDVTHATIDCDTVTGSIKFPTILTVQGTPGTVSNDPTVAVALDGCTTSIASVVIAATKFSLIIDAASWVDGGNHCELNGGPSDPAGSGTHDCHGTWAVGGKFDNAVHPTDINGNFGANGFSALAGASTSTPSTTHIAWKCTGDLLTKAKCVDDLTTATPGKPVSNVTIANNYGTTGADPFGVSRGAFYVGEPLNGTHGIPAATLDPEAGTGAFRGPGGSNGSDGTFMGMLQQSQTMLTSYLFGKGIKTLTFGVGTIHGG